MNTSRQAKQAKAALARRLAETVERGSLEETAAALDDGADPNDASSLAPPPPLIRAVLKGHANIVKTLLRTGARVNAVHPDTGGTALHEASRRGQVAIGRSLLSAGADADSEDNEGTTPLQAVAGAPRGAKLGELVRELIAAGARFDIVDKGSGNTPLHTAAAAGNEDVVERLLHGGAHLVAKNFAGQSPLHLAAKEGQRDLVGFLVTRGADPSSCDIVGRSPLYLAAVNGHAEVSSCLPSESCTKSRSEKVQSSSYRYRTISMLIYDAYQDIFLYTLLCHARFVRSFLHLHTQYTLPQGPRGGAASYCPPALVFSFMVVNMNTFIVTEMRMTVK